MSYMVKCTRCRHKHGESQRVWVPDRNWKGSTISTCPRCACVSVYHIKTDGKLAKFSERHLWAEEPPESEVSP